MYRWFETYDKSCCRFLHLLSQFKNLWMEKMKPTRYNTTDYGILWFWDDLQPRPPLSPWARPAKERHRCFWTSQTSNLQRWKIWKLEYIIHKNVIKFLAWSFWPSKNVPCPAFQLTFFGRPPTEEEDEQEVLAIIDRTGVDSGRGSASTVWDHGSMWCLMNLHITWFNIMFIYSLLMFI